MSAFSKILLYFYFYSFLGWIWESCYVSVHKRHWTNRGFLTGPMLPIYGSCAVIMLACTQPFNLPLAGDFLLGMIATTTLEYLTGVAMESLFKVRYWDYSNQKFNFQGHICLISSLTWGVFTVILTRVIHPRVKHIVEQIPSEICFIILTVITIIFVTDLAVSFHAAMDLRRVLESMTSLKKDMRKIRERLALLYDSVGDSIQGKIDSFKELEEEKLEDFQSSISERLEMISDLVPTEKFEDIGKLKERLACVNEFRNRIASRVDFRKKLLLRGNPMMTSPKYSAALKTLKEQLGIYSKSRKHNKEDQNKD